MCATFVRNIAGRVIPREGVEAMLQGQYRCSCKAWAFDVLATRNMPSYAFLTEITPSWPKPYGNVRW